MADNNFNIRVRAIDDATKVVNKINTKVNSLFRPYEGAKRSTKSFFDALGKNELIAKPIWGLQMLGGAVGNVGSMFGIAESSIMGSSARVAASLGAIGGPIGAFVGGAAAIAGATTAVAVKMGQLGFDVDRTAKNLGIATGKLQEYRGAAKLAGLSTESMDSSLGALGSTLQDAAAGRNLQVATLLSQMGITIKRTKDGTVDIDQAMQDISGVMGKMKDPNMVRKIGDMLGISPVIPLLREGTKELSSLTARAREMGLVMDQDVIEKNKKQADSWNQTKAAVDGMGTSLGNLIAQRWGLNDLAADTVKMAKATKDWADNKTKDNKDRPSPTVGDLFSGRLTTEWFSQYVSQHGRDDAHKGSRFASGKLTNADGSPIAGAPAGASTSPRGIRNNNPGNLRAWPGAGQNGGYASFATPELGITAMAKNLVAYQDKYGINTVSKVINRWAPASDNNNVASYVADVSKQTGYKPDDALNLRDPQVLAPLISAITNHENGQNPYSADLIAKAAAAAVRESQGGGGGGSDNPIRLVVEGLPHGMSIKAVRGLGQSSVGMTMLPGGAS